MWSVFVMWLNFKTFRSLTKDESDSSDKLNDSAEIEEEYEAVLKLSHVSQSRKFSALSGNYPTSPQNCTKEEIAHFKEVDVKENEFDQ